jgi:hypothetical protein
MVAIFFSSQLETSRDQPLPISKKRLNRATRFHQALLPAALPPTVRALNP